MATTKRSQKAKTPVTKVSDRRVRKGKLKPSDLKDLKKLGHIASLLESLHEIGAARDKAGNRTLHMDEYCLLVLMWIYNSVIGGRKALSWPNLVLLGFAHGTRTSSGITSR